MTEPSRREDAKREHDRMTAHFLALNQAVLSAGTATIQNLFLMHGGALVAMLTFAGALMQKSEPPVSIGSIMQPMIWFALGLAFATGASAGSYLTSYFQAADISTQRVDWTWPFSHPTTASRRWSEVADFFHVITIAAAMTSLGLFVVGFFSVREAFLQ